MTVGCLNSETGQGLLGAMISSCQIRPDIIDAGESSELSNVKFKHEKATSAQSERRLKGLGNPQ